MIVLYRKRTVSTSHIDIFLFCSQRRVGQRTTKPTIRRATSEDSTCTSAQSDQCLLWSHVPPTAKRDKQEPLPYRVDVQLVLSLCWSHGFYCRLCYALAHMLCVLIRTIRKSIYFDNLELYKSWYFHNIRIKHGFSCTSIRQVPWEVLKTEAGGRSFQHLLRDLANVNTLQNHVFDRYYCITTENICYISRYFLHYFVSPFHRCLANAISTDYARSKAGQYTSRNSSKSVAPVRSYWKLRRRALTARELR